MGERSVPLTDSAILLLSVATFANREEKIGVPRMKLELVDGITMSNIVL